MPDEPPTSGTIGRAAASDTNCHHSTDELSMIIGSNLRRLRRRRGHSLERLAQLSGVSRAMLGQIETGKSAPTVNLLWKVANALTVPFAQLVAAPDEEGAVILRREQAKILSSSGGKFTSRALFPFDAGRQVEFYQLCLAPLHRELADPHSPGTRENLVVAHGTVEIAAGKQPPFVLAPGDALLFEADVTHSYKNLTNEEAVLYLVMIYADAVR
jgi:transcriptional regulator with XRE-family HTH domain